METNKMTPATNVHVPHPGSYTNTQFYPYQFYIMPPPYIYVHNNNIEWRQQKET